MFYIYDIRTGGIPARASAAKSLALAIFRYFAYDREKSEKERYP